MPDHKAASRTIDLDRLIEEYPNVKIIEARSRAKAIEWGFALVIVTVVVGLACFAALDLAKLDTNPLREWLQTITAGEIGLLAGIIGSREQSG